MVRDPASFIVKRHGRDYLAAAQVSQAQAPLLTKAQFVSGRSFVKLAGCLDSKAGKKKLWLGLSRPLYAGNLPHWNRWRTGITTTSSKP